MLGSLDVGQLNIDEDCIAPKNTFYSWKWQEGPFFETEIDENDSKWLVKILQYLLKDKKHNT